MRERSDQHLLRELHLPQGQDFCSNDYLGFTQDAVLQKRVNENLQTVASGSSGSRLLRGHQDVFVQLERALAQWSERESALYFSTGYQANLGVLSALLDKNSLVFSDEENHASLIDGIRLSGADKKIFTHNNMEELELFLKNAPADKKKYIVVESIYSMSGDYCPLAELIALSQAHGAQVIVDEAHATGIYGAGRVQKLGLQNQVLLSIHSGAKALGVSGSWVACDEAVKDFLINFSRPFIYSTAPSPLVVSALHTAVEYWKDVGPDRADLVLDRVEYFLSQMRPWLAGTPFSLSGEGPIIYLNLHESAKALAWSAELRAAGFDIRAIRYPTVAEDQAGLRISIHANHSYEVLDRLYHVLQKLVMAC